MFFRLNNPQLQPNNHHKALKTCPTKPITNTPKMSSSSLSGHRYLPSPRVVVREILQKYYRGDSELDDLRRRYLRDYEICFSDSFIELLVGHKEGKTFRTLNSGFSQKQNHIANRMDLFDVIMDMSETVGDEEEIETACAFHKLHCGRPEDGLVKALLLFAHGSPWGHEAPWYWK